MASPRSCSPGPGSGVASPGAPAGKQRCHHLGKRCCTTKRAAIEGFVPPSPGAAIAVTGTVEAVARSGCASSWRLSRRRPWQPAGRAADVAVVQISARPRQGARALALILRTELTHQPGTPTIRGSHSYDKLKQDLPGKPPPFDQGGRQPRCSTVQQHPRERLHRTATNRSDASERGDHGFAWGCCLPCPSRYC